MGNHMYLVVTDDPLRYSVEFAINPDDFAAQLCAQWPNTEIIQGIGEALSYWNIHTDKTGFGIHDGSLFRQFVAFRPGPREVILQFVLWFRAFIPKQYPLLFGFDAYGTYIRIYPGITAQKVSKQMVKEWEWRATDVS